MSTALERVSAALVDGMLLSDCDVRELRNSMPVELQHGLQRLVAGVVATYHSNGGTSVSDWMGETVEEHLVHAEAHVARDNWRNHTRPGEGAPHGRCEEDGLRHLDHAACRIAMAFGREMMVR